jgi:hypothetical protein
MFTVTHERRRRDLHGRVARATWPARQKLHEFAGELGDLPCRILGHHWVEVPELLRRSSHSDGKKMRFKCSRCYLTGGFSN